MISNSKIFKENEITMQSSSIRKLDKSEVIHKFLRNLKVKDVKKIDPEKYEVYGHRNGEIDF